MKASACLPGWYPCGIVADKEDDSKAGSFAASRGLVIVIDDSLGVLETATRYLKSKGFDVLTSTHGFDVASLISRRIPEAVVLDVMMPALAGSTLAQVVRKHAPTTPIVFFSAIPEDKGRELVSGVSFSTFVPKTKGVAALYLAITSLIQLPPSIARS
jgi:DNA-binding response OmpR family regulator